MLADFPRSVVDDAKQLTYHERKERLICTYPGCPEPGDGGECEEHRTATAKRQAKSRRSRRKAIRIARKIWRKKKLCLGCGGKRLKGERRCVKCLVRVGEGVARGVTNATTTKGDRIASHTSIDADGRSRYRGQGKRGQPKRGAIDAKDLGYALDALGRGIKGLAFADALEGSALTKAQRQEAIGEALAQLNLSSGHIEDVLARHGYYGKVDPTAKPNRR